MRKVALAVFSLLVLITSVVPSQAIVQYVQVCGLYGAGWFYVPGIVDPVTGDPNTCINADTGETRKQIGSRTVEGHSTLATRVGTLDGQVGDLYGQTAAVESAQQAMQARFNADFRNAIDGSAIAMALDSPYLTESEHFGIKFNWGTYLGANAFGVTFAGVLAQHKGNRLTFTGGVAFTGSNIGGHAGVQFSW
jgi:hypothetical protein